MTIVMGLIKLLHGPGDLRVQREMICWSLKVEQRSTSDPVSVIKCAGSVIPGNIYL